MTSFFQPGSNDPAIKECGNSTFAVYCNSAIPTETLLREWYQQATLAVGGSSLLFPILLFIVLLARQSWFSNTFKRLVERLRRKKSGYQSIQPAPNLVTFESTRSFKVYSMMETRESMDVDRNYDLAIFPLTIGELSGDEGWDGSSMTGTACHEVTNLAYVNLQDMDPASLQPLEITSTTEYLVRSCVRNHLAGLALRPSSTIPTSQVEQLIQRLHHCDVSVLVLCHHDSPDMDSLSLQYASGVILENACILPNGRRRDYFKAKRLREVMVRCATERSQKPGFFIGFSELWETRPHPSVVRRAVKLAEHFGAVVEHGFADPSMKLERPPRDATYTLSAFEYLRRGVVTEIQKSWSSELRTVHVSAEPKQLDQEGNGKGTAAEGLRCLSLSKVDAALPFASLLLQHEPLPSWLTVLQEQEVVMVQPPNYLQQAPKRTDFWKYSADGTELSTAGCFSILAEPSAQDYSAVLQTQCHLRELKLLSAVKGAEIHRWVKSLQELTEHKECRALIGDLITGLKSQSVLVFRGLDTGFKIPDGNSYFFGVSRTRDERQYLALDIYISQSAPSDASAVLHTWLAHHGVSRATCFELEARLEGLNGPLVPGNRLPLSIRSAVESGTHAEILQLLQQMRVAHLQDGWRSPVESLCEARLTTQTSKSSWLRAHARRILDGSITIQDMLLSRLESYVVAGATELPSLENLVALYEAMSTSIRDALFYGDRDKLNALTHALIDVFEFGTMGELAEKIDVNADVFALMFFTAMRREAFEEVYIESTDRCPIFLCADQAAVFSELWVLGSQCEIFLGLLPRDLGDIIYDRYRGFLETCPPVAADRTGNEIMTMYSALEASPSPGDAKSKGEKNAQAAGPRLSTHETLQLWKRQLAEVGAITIFSLPAMIDVLLLTFLGRGLFMTAFMDPAHIEAAAYALLISLLVTAGVTGWVGSTGSYYLNHYAYDNMTHFHVQRLSGGFMLTLLIAVGGFVGFAIARSVTTGLVFVAFVVAVTTYLNLLGIMATMHQHGSPMTSGRTVLWRTIPALLVSPVVTTFVNGHDLAIYLPTTYLTILLLLYQYRQLCHEWNGWMKNIPLVAEKDILTWYESKLGSKNGSGAEEQSDGRSKMAQEALRDAVACYARRGRDDKAASLKNDAFVKRVAAGMPYIDWLFKKTNPDGNLPETFSSAWYTQLGESKKQQEQLARGLKEHNVVMLFRDAKFDLGQNLGLFLVALMDRWVGIIMSSGGHPGRSIYTDSRARYAICFCVLYFLIGVVVLDLTLQKYWTLRFTLSKDKLVDYRHAQDVASQWERVRHQKLGIALAELLARLLILFGITTLLMWILVDNPESMLLYYLYIVGYTGVILFQFNRCFTTNVHGHVFIILGSAIIGLIAGCILHAAPKTSGWLYSDVVAQNIAALLAAFGTLLWTWKDWFAPSQATPALQFSNKNKDVFYAQRKLEADPGIETGISIRRFVKTPRPSFQHGDGSFLSEKIDDILVRSLMTPNATSKACSWASEFIQTAFQAWEDGLVEITVVDRESFIDAGLQHLFSFSQRDGDVLKITAGFFGDYELRLPAWQTQLAQMIAESLMYHTARVEGELTHSQAVHAEHFLHGTTPMSKRIQFELALADGKSLRRTVDKTNSELLRRLSLDLNVDLAWNTLPPSVREAIVCRITGRQVKSSYEFEDWQFNQDVDVETIDFHLQLGLEIFRACKQRCNVATDLSSPMDFKDSLPPAELRPVKIPSGMSNGFVRGFFRRVTALPVTFARWVALISGGGSNIERELYYSLGWLYFRRPIIWIILRLWKLCWAARNFWIYYFLVYHRPSAARIVRLTQKGALRIIKKNSIVVELSRRTVTGFARDGQDGNLILQVFEGRLREAPEDKPPLFTATYDDKLRLASRTDRDGTTSTYNYDSAKRRSWPISRAVFSSNSRALGFYDKQGRLESGTMMLNSESLVFSYHYKTTPENSSDILRADFQPLDRSSNNKLSVFWGKPSIQGDEDYNWAPSEKIHRIVRVIGDKTYMTEIEYHHRRDPKTLTYLVEDGVYKTIVAVVPKAFPDEDVLLCRPRNLLFDVDDLLIHHGVGQINIMRQFASRKLSMMARIGSLAWWTRRVHLPVATWRSRTELWSVWLKGDLDAVTACWMDEMILREEPILRRYWRARDGGNLDAARAALDDIDQIVAAIELETDVSEVCLLPIRSADLYTMGLGKDANQVTNRPQDCYSDTKDRVSVIVNDIGCWPEAPGGVSNCRRDLVNGHGTIRNHVMAECANEYGIPRFQIEKNVQSLKLLPLWGLDGKTANHGLIDNMLQSEVDDNIRDTDVQRDIARVFVPLLKAFVKGARTRDYTRATLATCTNVMLSMSKYFESKDYNTTWSSKQVEEAWVEAWLVSYDDPNIQDPTECFDIARPTLFDFREALGIYIAYFFIFSVRIPDECPRVFQSTHHGISSLLGIILKYRRGVTFGIWDHAILWRESCLNISPAQCELPLSVQSMLLHGIRLASRLSYFHADVITPCTSLFNPMWETEIGSDRGNICNRNLFSRKIDPIVNGISNMDSFEPIDKVRTSKPTAVMLSNVQFIKGIKTAILAADIIVNRYGFKDYRLMVYGAKDRQPSYALEMAKLIVKNNLSENVILAGFGKPKEVLKDAWIFMNSSISEGLPLAIGEAALAGVPIVATEVGATALVMTDPNDAEQRYGEVVAPNDPVALARAQLNILCMVGPWTKFVEGDEGEVQSLPEEITPRDVERLYERMYAKTDDRRKLGLLSREVVLQSFHGERYLREHEQMYWIQWHAARMRADAAKSNKRRRYTEFSSPLPMRYVDEGAVGVENSAVLEDAELLEKSVKREEEHGVMTEKMAPTPSDLESGRVSQSSTLQVVHTGEMYFAGQAAASGFTNWAPG